MSEPALPPQTLAAIDLLRRTGAADFEIRYSDEGEDTGHPVVWIAISGYHVDQHGRPVAEHPNTARAYRVAAGMSPAEAIYRLADDVIDGAVCVHCHRPSSIAHDLDMPMPLAEHVCWYVYDPELSTYRRSCEGDT